MGSRREKTDSRAAECGGGGMGYKLIISKKIGKEKKGCTGNRGSILGWHTEETSFPLGETHQSLQSFLLLVAAPSSLADGWEWSHVQPVLHRVHGW